MTDEILVTEILVTEILVTDGTITACEGAILRRIIVTVTFRPDTGLRNQVVYLLGLIPVGSFLSGPGLIGFVCGGSDSVQLLQLGNTFSDDAGCRFAVSVITADYLNHVGGPDENPILENTADSAINAELLCLVRLRHA